MTKCRPERILVYRIPQCFREDHHGDGFGLNGFSGLSVLCFHFALCTLHFVLCTLQPGGKRSTNYVWYGVGTVAV